MRIAIAGLAPVALIGLVAGCGGGGNGTSATPPAAAVQQPFVKVVKDVSPQVVQIRTPAGLGSGIAFDNKGDIVTNAHVVGSYRQFRVTLKGGTQRSATLVGSYPPGDIAVVRLSGDKPKPATFGDSSKIQVGELALAIGNPVGCIVPGGPAARAGITAGEAILAVAGKPTGSIEDLNSVLTTLKPGQKTVITVVKPDGQHETLTITLGKRPGA
jgi:putative serine protease PepD